MTVAFNRMTSSASMPVPCRQEEREYRQHGGAVGPRRDHSGTGGTRGSALFAVPCRLSLIVGRGRLFLAVTDADRRHPASNLLVSLHMPFREIRAGTQREAAVWSWMGVEYDRALKSMMFVLDRWYRVRHRPLSLILALVCRKLAEKLGRYLISWHPLPSIIVSRQDKQCCLITSTEKMFD